MASRTEHEVVFKANTRGAKLAGQELEKALDPKKVRPLKKEVLDLESQFMKLLERQVKHPLYGNYIKRSTKVSVHDENNDCGEGDLVSITECRPISRTKSWRVVEVLARSQ